MSARELIKQVAALSPHERALFEQLLQNLHHAAGASGGGNPLEWADFSERLRQIYGDKIAPDSNPLVHDGRGDR